MKQEFSAGGIVFRKQNGKLQIVLGKHSGHHGWVFPKGLIGDHIEKESKEETAIREVKEETGINAKIIKALKPVTYWYSFKGEKRKKTVYYFLMEYQSGDIKDHDWEMEEVVWIDEDEVEKKLTYQTDKKVWQEAKQILLNLKGGIA